MGSLNLDLVYQMPHFVRAGETLSAESFQRNVGGKGLNQSVALSKAGAEVFHAGMIGRDGELLVDFLNENGVDSHYVQVVDQPSGHAVIQVIPEGNNSIFIYGGANRCITKEYIENVLRDFSEGDYLILQNEINGLNDIIDLAYARGMRIVLNPSPIDESIKALPFEKITWLVLNEIEGNELTGASEPDAIISRLQQKYPQMHVVLTLGEEGSVYAYASDVLYQKAYHANAVDTTAAGDMFTGYLIAAIAENMPIEEAMNRASIASALSVTRHGAAASIPFASEIDGFVDKFA